MAPCTTSGGRRAGLRNMRAWHDPTGAMTDGGLRARLLVASPTLRDPNFDRTVVLVLESGETGAIGVVLNRPSEVPLDGAVASWAHLAVPPATVFVGGPVIDEGTVVCLARARDGHPTDAWKPFILDIGTLDLNVEPADVGVAIEEIRVFSGYAGWAAGQLEAEIEAGAWFVVEGGPVDALTTDPDGLWEAVLGRQGGIVGMFVAFPADPSLN